MPPQRLGMLKPIKDRSVTPQGERFREHAGELLRQMLDSRGELDGKPLGRNEHIRIALPFAMAALVGRPGHRSGG